MLNNCFVNWGVFELVVNLWRFLVLLLIQITPPGDHQPAQCPPVYPGVYPDNCWNFDWINPGREFKCHTRIGLLFAWLDLFCTGDAYRRPVDDHPSHTEENNYLRLYPKIHRTRWVRYLENRYSNPRAGGLPLKMSKNLAPFYGLLTFATYSILFITGLQKYWLSILILTVLALYSLACSFNLYKRVSKGWKYNWDLIDKPKK